MGCSHSRNLSSAGEAQLPPMDESSDSDSRSELSLGDWLDSSYPDLSETEINSRKILLDGRNVDEILVAVCTQLRPISKGQDQQTVKFGKRFGFATLSIMQASRSEDWVCLLACCDAGSEKLGSRYSSHVDFYGQITLVS